MLDCALVVCINNCNAARPRLVYIRVAKPPPLWYIDYRSVDLPPIATIIPTLHTGPYSTP